MEILLDDKVCKRKKIEETTTLQLEITDAIAYLLYRYHYFLSCCMNIKLLICNSVI